MRTYHLDSMPDEIHARLQKRCPGGCSVHRYLRILIYEHVGMTCPPRKKGSGGKRKGAGRKPRATTIQ